jgi:hypothetical protein
MRELGYTDMVEPKRVSRGLSGARQKRCRWEGGYCTKFASGRGVRIVVEFTVRQREVLDYAVILTVEHQGDSAIVRSYDGAHQVNEMRRHSRRGGKAAGGEVTCRYPRRRHASRDRRGSPTIKR